MSDSNKAPRLYLDANIFIYAIEGNDSVLGQLRVLFDRLHDDLEPAVTSELTLAEILPKAPSINREIYFELIVNSGVIDLHSVSRAILLETADYRRSAGTAMPKLADAIHVVTAAHAGCTKMLSFDRGLRLPEGITHITNSEISNLLAELP